jgi:hypothetical protein
MKLIFAVSFVAIVAIGSCCANSFFDLDDDVSMTPSSHGQLFAPTTDAKSPRYLESMFSKFFKRKVQAVAETLETDDEAPLLEETVEAMIPAWTQDFQLKLEGYIKSLKTEQGMTIEDAEKNPKLKKQVIHQTRKLWRETVKESTPSIHRKLFGGKKEQDLIQKRYSSKILVMAPNRPSPPFLSCSLAYLLVLAMQLPRG